ncbi:MAG: SH3 domain-containing protein [Desulfobacterales bacterium]|jgi:SH3-like domain-containing protein
MVKTIVSVVTGAIILLLMGTVATVSAERLAVGGSIANIRAGAGTNYPVIWKVEKYHPMEIIQKSGEWYKFRDFEGDQGWIHKSLLQNIPSVITIKDNCNIRSDPSTQKEILFIVDKGIPFKVLERQESWIHIQHADGDKGWIHKSLVW